MLKKLLKKENDENSQKEKISPKNNKGMDFEQAVNFIQEEMMRNTVIDGNEVTLDDKQRVLNLAMSRNKEAVGRAKYYIEKTFEQEGIEVNGYNLKDLAQETFAKVWGLDVLEKYTSDKLIDEIRVNGPDTIFIVKKGIPNRIKEKFQSEESIEHIIKRMIMENLGTVIDESNPRIEAVLLNGARLTAMCPPVSPKWVFALRLHESFNPTLENYLKSETFDEKVWDTLRTLVKGRAKILISGNVGSGKTTLLRKLVGEVNDRLRIYVIGKDLEVLLQNLYDNKDIIETQEQPHLDIYMKDLLYSALRMSPDIIIVEEFRGAGEAIEAIRSCTRGFDGSMATAHFNTPQEAVEGCALYMLEEGLSLPIEMAKLRVTRAYDIVVQMLSDSITGKKKVVGITEIGADKDGEIYYNDLLKWVPTREDEYFGEGTWEFQEKPSRGLMSKLLINVKKQDLEKLGWVY
ncbi:ATPase, T2SS/T4P/T4SS family [Wukongibacter baidiensis]